MMTWDRMFGALETTTPDVVVIATTTKRWTCGSTSEIQAVRDGRAWRLITPDYTETFRTKKALLAAFEAFA